MSINEIRARNREAFNFPDGIKVHGFGVDELYYKVEELNRTQQLADESYRIAAEKAAEASQSAASSESSSQVSQDYAQLSKDEADRAHLASLTAFSSPSTSSHSQTQLSLELGIKTLIIETGKFFAIGQFVLISYSLEPDKYMVGQVTYLERDTGVMTVNVRYISLITSRTFNDWTITVTLTEALFNDFVRLTDPRLSDSRPPTGTAGGVLSGSYPNPGFAVPMATKQELDTHSAKQDNPHAVTKTQVGLGSVDNTSDLDKPISTATQAALNTKQATLVSSTNIKTVGNKSILGAGDVGLVKADVGLNNVDNTADNVKNVLTATKLFTPRTIAGSSFDGTSNIDINYSGLLGRPALGTASSRDVAASGNASVTQVVLGGDTRLTDDRVPKGTAGGVLSGSYPNPGFAVPMATQASMDSHTGNNNNPHAVTKTQVGLGNVDNTSDANKPISTAVQAALNTKQSTLVSGTNIKTINGEPLIGAGNIVFQTTEEIAEKLRKLKLRVFLKLD